MPVEASPTIRFQHCNGAKGECGRIKVNIIRIPRRATAARRGAAGWLAGWTEYRECDNGARFLADGHAAGRVMPSRLDPSSAHLSWSNKCVELGCCLVGIRLGRLVGIRLAPTN